MRMLVAAALVAAAWLPARAQSIDIFLSATVNDSTSPAPVINVIASSVPPEQQPASVTFEISFESQFRNPFFVRATPGTVAQFQLDSLLPQRTTVYMRARMLDRSGVIRAERDTAVHVHDWLTLVSPTRTTDVLFSRQPTFSFRSPAITLPPGPWIYTVTIFNVGQNKLEQQATNVSKTDYVPTVPLDACTSYRWSVTARAQNGGANDQITVSSPGTFVIQAPECPSATLFLQPFPNPFGIGTLSNHVCFWFDLAHRARVTLTIYDIRLRQVRRLVPGAIGVVLDSGAYGRQSPDLQTGCDERLTWNGKDDRGSPVPAGVYIAVFDADGVRTTHKILYKGP